VFFDRDGKPKLRIFASFLHERYKKNCFDSKVLEVYNEDVNNNNKLMLEISQNSASQLIL